MGLLCLYAAAQQPAIKPLTIGDTVPDITFTNLINYPTKTAKLSDFKGKLVILDFWSSWCGACLQLFPYMDSLQKQFEKDIKIILVNGHSAETGDDLHKITAIINRVKKSSGNPLNLTVAYNTPSLDAFFPHKYLPHEVLLNKQGKVIAITTAEELTRDNIKSLLAGKQLKLRPKQDDLGFSSKIPLFVNGNGGDGSTIIFRSLFTPYIDGIPSRIGTETKASQSRFYIYNTPLLTLLRIVYPYEMRRPVNQLILEDSSSQKLLANISGNLNREQLFCYELICPESTETRLYEYIKEDIYKTFNLSIHSEKRNILCWVLTATPALRRSYTKGGDSRWSLTDRTSIQKYIRNKTIAETATMLSDYLPHPLLDETGISKSIDLALPQNLHNSDALLQSLKRAGFSVTLLMREIPVTIISTTNNQDLIK